MTDSQSPPLLEVHESATGEVSPRSAEVSSPGRSPTRAGSAGANWVIS
ncbi:MAG: hypothetical protein KF718_13925 [Polyangiaceae bacterium]|nr:hypothetical protein [Polyangiaceae bacterium]